MKKADFSGKFAASSTDSMTVVAVAIIVGSITVTTAVACIVWLVHRRGHCRACAAEDPEGWQDKHQAHPREPGRHTVTLPSTPPATPPHGPRRSRPSPVFVGGETILAVRSPANLSPAQELMLGTTNARPDLLTVEQAGDVWQVAPLDVPAFLALNQQTVSLDAIPAGVRTQQYNRFINITPSPASRVQLTLLPEDENSHYINASFIRGHDGHSRTYICAQAPLPTTVEAFWRMIWEHRVCTIIMATQVRFSAARQRERRKGKHKEENKNQSVKRTNESVVHKVPFGGKKFGGQRKCMKGHAGAMICSAGLGPMSVQWSRSYPYFPCPT